MVWGGKWEGGLRLGTRVHPWQLGEKVPVHLICNDIIFNLVTFYFSKSFNDQGKKLIEESKTAIV